jgi:hypothetical protein
MESSDLLHAFSGAYKYGVITLGLVVIYMFSERYANGSRSMRNPPWTERISMMAKGIGVLLLIALFFWADKEDEDSHAVMNERRSTLIFFTTLPAMILGISAGCSREKQDPPAPPTGPDVM